MSPRAWGLFALLSVLWGVPYLFIKVAVDEIPPGALAWGRIMLGFLVLLPFALHRGAFRGLGARWKPLAAFAVLEMVIPWPLIGFGEQRVTSSLAAILIAAVPLVIAVLALRWDPEERADAARLVGMLVGFAGVVLLLGLDVAGDPAELVGALAILVATVGYAAGPFVLKRHLSDVDPLGPVTGALGIAGLLLTPVALAAPPEAIPSGQALASVAVLGLLCSAVAFLALFALIAEIGPGRASIITYVNPAVAVGLGVALLGEDLGAGAIAGLLLIIFGSWWSTGNGTPPGLGRLADRRARRAGLATPPLPAVDAAAPA